MPAAVARARPDGYTACWSTQTHVNEALLKSRPLYDPIKDLESDRGRGRQCSLYRRPSGSASVDGRGANCLREGKSRKLVTGTLGSVPSSIWPANSSNR